MTDCDRSLFMSDVHIPEHDRDAVRVALAIVEHVRPDRLFLVGDIFDFYQMSSFDRDPNRVLRLQDELDELSSFFEKLRGAVGPTCRITYLEGNHEHRLIRWLWKHPELCNLRSLQPEAFFRLGDFDIDWHPSGKPLLYHGFAVTHGTLVRKAAGASAKGEYERYGTSGISGHTHRVGSYRKRDLRGECVWYEGGCLCSLAPEWVSGIADWHHAVSVGHFVKESQRFQIQTVNIVGGEALYDGIRFS